MKQNAEELLLELKSVLGDLYDQNDDKNKELIGLVRALVKRIELAENEIFNSDGSLNEIRERVKALEYLTKSLKTDKEQKEEASKERKAKLWGVVGKVISGVVIGVLGYIASHLQWI